jgi:beta-glucosidase
LEVACRFGEQTSRLQVRPFFGPPVRDVADEQMVVSNGSVPGWRIDDMATRVMAAYYKVGQDRTDIPINFDSWTLDTFGFLHYLVSKDYTLVNQHVDVRHDPKIGSHTALAREVATKSIVLLKNVNGTLPLVKPRQIAVIGEDAGEAPYGPNGCPDRGCDSGTLAMGWGSGTANFPYLITPLTGIQNQAVLDGSVLSSVTDNYAYLQINATVSRAEVAIVFVNADSGEEFISVDNNGGDRNNLTLWMDGDKLVSTVAANNNNTIVVLHTVGPVIIESWANHPNITAILWAGLPGEQSGNSITDVLYGRVNPGAKLPFTLGKKADDWGVKLLYNSNDPVPQIAYTEGVFIDYRAFDKAGIEPTYEFGYGLSYTTFKYTDLQVKKTQAGPYVPTSGNTQAAPVLGNSSTNPEDFQFPPGFVQVPRYIYPWINSTAPGSQGPHDVPDGARDGSPQCLLPAGGAPGGNPELYDVLYEVTATVTNTGNVAGEEVAQLVRNRAANSSL